MTTEKLGPCTRSWIKYRDELLLGNFLHEELVIAESHFAYGFMAAIHEMTLASPADKSTPELVNLCAESTIELLERMGRRVQDAKTDEPKPTAKSATERFFKQGDASPAVDRQADGGAQ